MPRDTDYFTRDKAFLERARADLASVQTVRELKYVALSRGWRGAGTLIAQKIDRLTQMKVKSDGSRDGKWIYQNVQALMGRRISEERNADAQVACALQSLIVNDHAPDEFWALRRDKRGRLQSQKIMKSNDPSRYAIDILTILIQKEENHAALPS